MPTLTIAVRSILFKCGVTMTLWSTPARGRRSQCPGCKPQSNRFSVSDRGSPALRPRITIGAGTLVAHSEAFRTCTDDAVQHSCQPDSGYVRYFCPARSDYSHGFAFVHLACHRLGEGADRNYIAAWECTKRNQQKTASSPVFAGHLRNCAVANLT